MLDLVKLRSRAQVTLPKEAVKTLNLKEGDNLSVEVANGKVIMTPVAVIPRDELWAWSSKMRGVIEKSRLEAKEGNLKGYDSVEELWQDLHVAEGEADDLYACTDETVYKNPKSTTAELRKPDKRDASTTTGQSCSSIAAQ